MNPTKTNSNYAIFFTLLFVFILSLSGPGFSQEPTFPITFTDESGEATTITEKPIKIISTAPSNTEIVFALGLEDRLVGITDFCNYPQGTQKIESIGKMFPLNLEKIVSIQPDIILAFGQLNPLEDIIRLRQLGLKVLMIQPESLPDTLSGIKLISLVCGVREKGEQVVSHLQQRINQVTSQATMLSQNQKPKVFAGSSYDTIWCPGRGTLLDELITLAGGENIVGDQNGWVPISPEFIAQAEPDIILVPSGIMNPKEISKIKNDIRQHPGWAQVPAIKNNQIFAVNEDLFYRAGPRLVDGMELLYEIFAKSK